MKARIRDIFSKANFLIYLCVVIPTSISILYYGLIASDGYVSISKFVVRSPDKPSSSGLGILLKTAGFSNASDEMYAVQNFISSRDALMHVEKTAGFKSMFTKPTISIFDKFNPTGFYGSFEDLYRYYTSKVGVEFDSSSSTSTLTVNAYSPEDAHRINEQLLELAEKTVNRLNVRGREDLVQFAEREVDDAKLRSRNSALALARFRNSSGIVDPERQATIQLQMISKLQDELIATQTRITELRALAPRNPQIESLIARAKAIRTDIEREGNKVAGNTGSLSARSVEYQSLIVESQVADKQLAGALASLEDARNEARRKQAYIERIVQPNTPDSPLQPRRIRGVVTTLLLGLVAWAILSMLLAGVKEHND